MPGYWERRAAARMDRYLRDSQQTVSTVSRAYQRALQDIQDDLKRIFKKFSRDNNLTREEARAFLSQDVDQSEYEQLLQDISTIRDPEVRRLMQARANAPAYRYRMTRAQALAERIHTRMGQVADVEITADRESFINTIQDAYGRSMFDIQRGTGLGFAFDNLSVDRMQEILRNPWSGEVFSERVWHNTQALADQLNETVTAGFLSGRSIYDMADDLEHLTSGGRHAAMRVIRTETCYLANSAELESYKAAGIDQYEFMATLDNRTSPACQDLDGQVFAVKDAKAGVNLPPMHPHCRSTTVAHFDDQTMDDLERAAKDPVTGETVKVPRDMSYKDWVESFGTEQMREFEINRSMALNHAKDADQHGQYTGRLPGITPNSLNEFQRIKYSDANQWGVLQAQYKGMGYYEKAIQSEPEITRAVSEVAKDIGLDQAGLEYRIKGKDSYLRKVVANYNPNGTSYEVKDILRYTYTTDPQSLAQKTNAAIAALGEKGYTTFEVKNTWLTKNAAYRGINTSARSNSGQAFEVQYHTPESFALKNGRLHELYEKARVLDPRSEEFLRLYDEMIELSAGLTIPDGIEEVRLR